MLPLFMPIMNVVEELVFMEKRNLPFGALKAVRLYFTFGVKAAPNHVSPGAD